MAKASYKPLLYTTTIRNPERVKDFMFILYKYKDQILSNKIIDSIEKDAFKIGLYRPTHLTESVANKWRGVKQGSLADIALTEHEATEILNLNDPSQNAEIKGHKEAGFDKGWPSRFDTQYKLMKRLGFVYYKIGEKIEFSTLGEYMAKIVNIKICDGIVIRTIEHPEYEQMAFLQSMAKEQRCNPFIRELNDNNPLVLLLETIKLINKDEAFNNCGIARHEIPLLLFWKDNNAEKLYKRIKKLRQEYRYNPSNEVIEDICVEEILGGDFHKFKTKSIVQEYPDDFIRKMRLTGLISLRGGGRFIDINHNEDPKVEYVISHYKNYKKFEDELDYFHHISTIDNELFSIERQENSCEQNEELLVHWGTYFGWDKVKTELEKLGKKSSSTDDILKFIPEPARLEFLTALAIKLKFPEITVSPNYPCDDTGLPTSTALGNRSDIECYKNNALTLVEVTMSEGRSQTMMEIWPITRHMEEYTVLKKFQPDCIFVAPSIYYDSQLQINYVKTTKGLEIRPYVINDFVNHLDSSQDL